MQCFNISTNVRFNKDILVGHVLYSGPPRITGKKGRSENGSCSTVAVLSMINIPQISGIGPTFPI